MSAPDQNKQATRVDYEKEKVAALVVEFFKKRAEMAELHAEIAKKYPKVANEIREKFPDIRVFHKYASEMYEKINQSEQ